MGGACVKTTTGVSALAARTASNHRICSSSMCTSAAAILPVGTCWHAHCTAAVQRCCRHSQSVSLNIWRRQLRRTAPRPETDEEEGSL